MIAKSTFMVPIDLIVVVIDPMQFFRWVALSCIFVYIVLGSIIGKFQCSVFHAKKNYQKGTYLCNDLNPNLKWHFSILSDLLISLF